MHRILTIFASEYLETHEYTFGIGRHQMDKKVARFSTSTDNKLLCDCRLVPTKAITMHVAQRKHFSKQRRESVVISFIFRLYEGIYYIINKSI